MLYKNENDLAYRVSVERTEMSDRDAPYMVLRLDLVAGKDYINPDYSEAYGWVSAEGFIDDFQLEHVLVYFMSETAAEALEEAGYTKINEPIKIYEYCNYPSYKMIMN